MAQQSGFFNSLKDGANYDRKYNANDYSNNMGAIIGTGVRRSGENDLRVNAVAGTMNLTINVGRAWIQGRWYYNDAIFTDYTVPTAPMGDSPRIDRVILRLDTNTGAFGDTEKRLILLDYLQGEESLTPVAPALTREGGIYEIALADIYVGAGVTSITQENITDQRGNGKIKNIYIGDDEDGNPMYKVVAGDDLCGWITSPVGYDEYFTALDVEFEDWFAARRQDLAVSTLFKRYHQRITTEALTSAVTVTIPQYDPTGVDILEIFINGILAVEGEDYTANGTIITFTAEKIIGTDIDIFVYKSIDGTGLGSVSDEITELQEQMATIKNIGEYIYICNGIDDNVKLSDLAQEFLNGGNDNNQMIISVYGDFGATVPYAGSGTTTTRYRWLSLGTAGSTSRKIVFDFGGCSQITLNCQAGYHYIGFYGQSVNIKNANVVANCRNTDGSFEMFSSATGSIVAENCRFWISGYTGCSIAQTGTFINCRGDVTNSRADSYCFNVNTGGILRINGGEYYSYTGLSANNAAVIYIAASSVNAIAISYGMNCPTVSKELHYQKNAILCNAGYGSFSETITALTMTKATNQNVRGTIVLSKPDR